MKAHERFSYSWKKVRPFIFCLIVTVFSSLLPITTNRAFTQTEATRLELNIPVEREIGGSEVHVYRVTLAAGELLQVRVTQKSVDVILRFLMPDGALLVENNSPEGLKARERVSFVSQTAGDYRIEIIPTDKDKARGLYEIKLETLRAATAQDESRVIAERTFDQAELLRAKGTGDARREAVEKYQESLPHWQKSGDLHGEVNTLNRLVELCYIVSETQKGLDFALKALALYQQLGDRAMEAETLSNIGIFYDLLGQARTGLGYSLKSIEILQKIGDKRREAIALNNIALLYDSLGEFQTEIDYLKRSLALRREAGDKPGEARTLINLGTLYHTQGNNREALVQYEQALALMRELKDARTEAILLNNIGTVYSSTGESQNALDLYAQSLELRRRNGDKRGEAITLSNIAKIYLNLGDVTRAIELSEQALLIVQSGKFRYNEAITLSNLAAMYSSSGDEQKALEYEMRALEIRRAIEDLSGQAASLSGIGLIYLSQGETNKAMGHFQQALSLALKMDERDSIALNYKRLGVAFAKSGDKQKAEENYLKALELNRAIQDRDSEADVLYHLARLEYEDGRLDQALQRMTATLKLIETLRRKVVSRELRAAYLASSQENYKFYIELLMEKHRRDATKGFDREALRISEQARARSLLDLLSEARADIREGVDPKLLDQERELNQAINAKEVSRLNEKKKEKAAALESELAKLVDQRREVLNRIRATSPQYAALTQPTPIELNELQRELVDQQTLLLEFSLGDEKSYLWIVSNNQLLSFELPPRAVIEKATQRVYELLTARNKHDANAAQQRARITKADAEFYDAAAQLSHMLFGPAASALTGKRLLIVSEGALQYVPFAALPVPEGRTQVNRNAKGENIKYTPLITRYEIVNLPSASVLSVLRQMTKGRKQAVKALAVLADPVFSQSDQRLAAAISAQSRKSIEPQNETPLMRSEATNATKKVELVARTLERSARDIGMTTFVRLPFSRQEADGISVYVSEKEVFKALDFDANLKIIINPELAQYRIIHLATHGLLNNRHPDLSGIVFSLVDETGQPQNGFLRLHEIYNLRLNADLVVLSACETGLGQEIKGEGLIGLTRGFMYAGAPRVVASLWRVDDRATAELMKRFYQKMLKEGLRPAAALREAQKDMWQQVRWTKPHYWAGFTFQGDWR